MKSLKMLGLAAVAAAAMMAVIGVGTASATEITCANKVGGVHEAKRLCNVGETMHAVSIGKAVLDAPFGNVECESTVHGTVTTPGSASTTASGHITQLIWSNCGSDTVHTLANGSLEIHTDTPNVNDGNGTLTSSGSRVTVVHLGFHCIFETNNTDIGTVDGSTKTGGHAILTISAIIPRVGGSSGFFCGSSAPWTGNYTLTTPATLHIH